MIPIHLKERKEIQKDILTAIDKFCNINGIKYSIACGTMLGAVRHGGYIPWDDDIDIHMLREDFRKFEKLFPTVYDSKYKLHSLNNNPEWRLSFAKVEDIRTRVFEEKSYDNGIGINIDIFPIDEVPSNEKVWEIFNKKRRKIFRELLFTNIKFSKKLGIIKNLVVVLIRIRFLLYNRKRHLHMFDDFIQQYNGQGNQLVFETSSGMFCKSPFPKKLFYELTDLQFEDRTYKGYKDYKTYLTATYGANFMTPPPVDKRISYHVNNAFWI